MAEDDQAKAEKLAAAKKRVEQLKKAKAKKAGGAPASSANKADTAETSKTDEPEAQEAAKEEGEGDAPAPLELAAPSLSQQSKARSTSFRKSSFSGLASPGLFSPDGETAPEIYRKHVARIEELEKENRRLAKEATDAEKRWQKAEEELADVREADGETVTGSGGSGSEVDKLKSEIAALQRQNAQLQSQASRTGGATGAPRHGSSPSISLGTPPLPASELETQLQAKSSTIETMELEMSRLRAQVERLSVSASEPPAQIAALEAKLARAENAAALAQRELADLKRNLARTAESAVKAGSERASAETKLRTLEREAAEAAGARDELARRADALDKKVATLTTLHKEQDARMQALRRDKERVDKELAGAQEEASRLRKKAAADASGAGADDEGVDELEDEERGRLAKRIRELEAENTDLRRGIWHDRRKEMQVGPEEASRGFRDVDLPSPSLRKSAAGLGDFLASGLHVLTGGTAAAAAGGGEQDELLLEDDAMEFDEDAFRKAQEEEGKKRIERIKEIKRGLKNWAGWRLDLVESRRGGGEGIGEIFEV